MKILDVIFYIIYFFVLFYSVYMLTAFLTKIFNKKEYETEDYSLTATIVIPAFNEEKNIGKTISSALKLDYPKSKIKIVVVDDGSTDNTLKVAREFEKEHSNVKVISQKNIGKGASLNKVLKQTNTDLFIVFDSDSRIEKDALKKIVPYFKEEDVAAVSPFMKVEKPKTLLQKVQYLEYLLFSFLRKIHSSINSIYVIPGPFSVYKTSILKELNGFDEKSIVEDQEIAWRLQKEGYKILQNVNVNVYTVSPDTLKKLVKQRKRWYKGALQTIIQHKDALFNLKLGDFGLFQAPSLAFNSFILPILGAILIINIIIIPFFKKIYAFYFSGVHFNFNFSIKDFWISTDFTRMILISILLIITLFWFYNAFFYSDRKFNKKDIIPLLFYMIIYYIIMTYVLLIAIIEVLLKKDNKW